MTDYSELIRQLRCFNPVTGKRDGHYCVWQGGGKCLKCQAADALEAMQAKVKKFVNLNQDKYNKIVDLEQRITELEGLVQAARMVPWK